MKKLLLSAALLATNLSFAQTPDLEWAKNTGSTSSDVLRDIATDNLGNTISVGDFRETMDLDPGVGVQSVTSAGESDIMVRKLDPDGNLLWVHTFGNYAGDIGSGVACDNFGNIYVTGSIRAQVDFDPGSGTFILGINATSSPQAFILKLNSDGNFVWAKEFGTAAGNDDGYEVESDLSGNIIASGTFQGTVDFDPGAGIFELSANPSNNYGTYFVKLTSLGDFEWAGTTGGDFWNNRAHDLHFDNSGNVLITGSYGGTADLDPTTGTQLATANGYDEIYVIKLDQSGGFLWAHSFGGVGGEYGNSIINDELGNIYVTGQLRQTVDFDPGVGTAILIAGNNTNTFIQKLNPAGDLIWVKQFSGPSIEAYSMKNDEFNNLYLTGYFQGTVDVDPSANEVLLYSLNGTADIFVVKLDVDGNYLWSAQFGGEGGDFGRAIAVFDPENIYVSGGFELVSDFNPSADVYNLTSNGSTDQYTFKLGVCSIDTVLSVSGITMSSNATSSAYQWVDCDNNYAFINGETNQQYTATSNGNYAVIITKGACTDTSDCVLINSVGVNSLEFSGISIYPNPTNDNITISSEAIINEVMVLDATGKIVKTTTQSSFSVAELTNGIYFLKVSTDNGTVQSKFIKE